MTGVSTPPGPPQERAGARGSCSTGPPRPSSQPRGRSCRPRWTPAGPTRAVSTRRAARPGASSTTPARRSCPGSEYGPPRSASCRAVRSRCRPGSRASGSVAPARHADGRRCGRALGGARARAGGGGAAEDAGLLEEVPVDGRTGSAARMGRRPRRAEDRRGGPAERERRGGHPSRWEPRGRPAASRGIPLVVDAQASLGRDPVPEAYDVLVGDARSWGWPAGVGVLAVPERTRWRVPGR